jgi:hypothetical protein
MNTKAIGGYFELELPDRGGFLHDDGVLLNSGRNALEYILRSLPDIKHLWIPYYTCEVVFEPVKKLDIPFSFYHINEKLEIDSSIELGAGDYLLYTNYFGIKDAYVECLASKYGIRLIVDNAQAWFTDPIPGTNTIYSPRKFVGVPDGGIAYCPYGIDFEQFEQDYSYERFSHLLKRIDVGPTEGYQDFRENSKSLVNQPIRSMSKLTKRLLKSIDFEDIKKRRIVNFRHLDVCLREMNSLSIPASSSFVCPMVYPFLSSNTDLRGWMIENRVYVASYWPNVTEWTNGVGQEHELSSCLLPLPCDQRLITEDLQVLIQHLCNGIYR